MRDQLRRVASKENAPGNTTSEEALDLWWKGLEITSSDSSASVQATLKALATVLDQAVTS